MKFMMAGGGTGGGLFPSVAVVDALSSSSSGHDFLFVGTPQGFEANWLPNSRYSYHLIEVKGLKGKKWLGRLASLLKLPGAFWKSWKLLQEYRPHLVFGSGGYVAGPMVMASALKDIRTAILEPNAVPGLTTRILAHFVDRIFLAFEEAENFLPREKCQFTGNPIREEIESVLPPEFKGSKIRILIFGGSQGAQKINQAILDALPQLDLSRVSFIHQTGKADYERVQKTYAEIGVEASVYPFIEDMAEAYRNSDLVLARAGSSVLEILACGRPSILVPYPWAADDHQRANARYMQKIGASEVLENDQLDGQSLSMSINRLLQDPDQLVGMRNAALAYRKTQASKTIAREMEKLVGFGECGE